MKVLVTLGTTRFDGLVEFFDKKIKNIDVLFQIPKKGRQAIFWPSIEFTKNFNSLLNEQDLVITHCGAGNVYSLLEKNIKFCAVPNLDRKDKHQLELANYLVDNRLSYVLNLEEKKNSTPQEIIDRALANEYKKYINEKPFDIDMLCNEVLKR